MNGKAGKRPHDTATSVIHRTGMTGERHVHTTANNVKVTGKVGIKSLPDAPSVIHTGGIPIRIPMTAGGAGVHSKRSTSVHSSALYVCRVIGLLNVSSLIHRTLVRKMSQRWPKDCIPSRKEDAITAGRQSTNTTTKLITRFPEAVAAPMMTQTNAWHVCHVIRTKMI